MIVFAMADMLLGMILGMIASPVVMKAIKSFRQKRKVNRLLRDAADHQERKDVGYVKDQRYKMA
jgi:Tfp pilus assembly protein PilW